MSANLNTFEEDFLDETLKKLDSSFGSRQIILKKFIDEAKNSISNLKNSLAYQKVDEVAALARRREPFEVVEEKLHLNFPAGVSIGKVEEMLKLIYVGSDCTENLTKVINFVQVFESKHHAEAYKSIYEDAKFKNHIDEPEMLLLQKRIGEFQNSRVLHETKIQLDADCCKIITSIVEKIKDNDYSHSTYIATSIESELLDDCMPLIVHKLSNTMGNFLLLIQYADHLPFIDNVCVLIDTLLKELDERHLLASEQAMHLWALARAKSKIQNLPSAKKSIHKLCLDAFDKLNRNKHVYLRLYQKYVDQPDDHNIRDLHKNNRHLLLILTDFVSFYYNGDLGKAQHLLTAVKFIHEYVAAGCILTQLHSLMAKQNQLNSFEAFRLFNEIKRYMSFSNFTGTTPESQKRFEKLKCNALSCVRLLLWPESIGAEFLLVNKFFNAATLSIIEEGGTVVCFASEGAKRYYQTWRITVDADTSLLTLKNAQNSQKQLDVDSLLRPCLTQTGAKWMVKAIDQQHVKIFCNSATGAELFLTAEVASGKEYHRVSLRKENNTEMQLWNIISPKLHFV